MKKYESIPFLTDDGLEIEFCILEQTMINGVNYLLVADSDELSEEEDEGEATVYIMKSVPDEDDAQEGISAYEFVEEEAELLAVSKVFEQLIEEMDIEVE